MGELDIWGVTKGPRDRTFDQSIAQGALGMEGGWGECVPGRGISRSIVPEVGAGKGHLGNGTEAIVPDGSEQGEGKEIRSPR